MTTYTAEQLGERDIRPVSTNTKPGSVSLIVFHPDNDQTVIAQPLTAGAQTGRKLTLGLLARGVDLDHIRIVILPPNATEGEEAGDGLPLEHVRRALWWTADDDRRCGEMPRAEYARGLLGIEVA